MSVMRPTRQSARDHQVLVALYEHIWSSFSEAERMQNVSFTGIGHRVDDRTSYDNQHGNFRLPLVARCAAVGRRDDLQRLVAAGADPHALTCDDSHFPQAALLAACERGHADIVDDLLGWGGSPHVDDHFCRQNLPLWKAAHAPQHRLRIVHALVAHGADIHATGHQGAPSVVLTVAAHQGCDDVVAWLLDQGVKPAPQLLRGLLSILSPQGPALMRPSIDLLLQHGYPVTGDLINSPMCKMDVQMRDTLIERLTDLTFPAPRTAIAGASPLAQTMHDVWRVVGGRRKTLPNESVRHLQKDHAIRDRILPLVVDAMTAGNPHAAGVLAHCGDSKWADTP